MTTRHEFLAELHTLLKPKAYLEVGVQYGWSLDLAHSAEVAFGIDPYPLVEAKGNQVIHRMESDAAFAGKGAPVFPPIDFAFIDGMHRFEYALRDFINIERLAHAGTIVVFDDVLPRNQEEAARIQCPGDWTGDVWKIHKSIPTYRPDLKFRLVDTQPTGLLLVTGFKKNYKLTSGILGRIYESLVHFWSNDLRVPDDVINRTDAWAPEIALEEIRNAMEAD